MFQIMKWKTSKSEKILFRERSYPQVSRKVWKSYFWRLSRSWLENELPKAEIVNLAPEGSSGVHNFSMTSVGVFTNHHYETGES